ncbi:MAG: hypothetical protein HIU57_02190 [Acidobacteria bacterium]|nr:hypothetical protein [Acidobacteriota bacterium]
MRFAVRRRWWSTRVARAVLAVIPLAGLGGVFQGSSAGATSSASATMLKWTSGTTLSDAMGGVNAVSCATSTFCVAVDRSGAVSRFNGLTWSAPQTIDGTTSLTAISCPTSTFCVATDVRGDYVMMEGAAWGQPTPFASLNSPVMQSVSCPTSSFCLAVGQTANFAPIDYYFYNGVWSPDAVAFSPSDTSSFNAVSCTASLTCLATDLGGGVMTFSFSATPTPTLSHAPAPTPIDAAVMGFAAASIACVSATSCVVGSKTNQVSVFNGTSWTTSTVFMAGATGVQVSCALATCVANDSLGQGISAVAPFGTWSNTGQLNMLSQIDGLSCFALTTSVGCLAVDNDGFSVAISLDANGVPTYTPAASFFDPPHTLTSVSCANPSYCIASDAAGETFTLRNGSWSPAKVVTTVPLGIREVRCGPSERPYASLACAAIIGDFHALSLRSYRAAWSPALPSATQTYAVSCASRCEYLSPAGRSSGLVGGYLPRLPLGDIATDVSCPATTTDCVAIDNAGQSYVSQKGRWHLGPRVESNRALELWSLSCATMSFCVAVDIQGHAYTFDGTKWSAGAKVSKLGLYAVSCGATYFCVASDLLGGAFVYNGARWLATANVSGFNILHGVSCASATSCVAVDSTKAYRLTVPTARTTIAFDAPSRGASVVGRTVIAVKVSSTTAPRGVITLSAGTKVNAPSCTATLKAVSATTSHAHCTIATTRTGATLFDATFSGSYGFAPSLARPFLEMIVAR